MKFRNFLMISGCLLAASVSAQNYNESERPFKVEVFEFDDDEDYDDDDNGYQQQRQQQKVRGWGNKGIGHAYLNNQVCQAIQRQSRLQIILKNTEVVNAKELKMTTKLITIEPYAFGMSSDGLSLLKGNVVDQKDLKEITIKVFEDRFKKKDSPAYAEAHKKGWFKSDDGVQIIALRGVKGIRLVPNTRFDTPKDFKGFQDDKDIQVQTICSLPTNDKQKNAENATHSDMNTATHAQKDNNYYR